MKNLEKAIREWKSLLTAKRVVTDPDVLKEAGTATFATRQKILAIIKPMYTTEVADIMKIAGRNSIPVYPVSGGKNWGLGSKVPQQNGVVVDLSLMKKIRAFDESMAYITVEPGVTFKEVESFLARRNSSLMVDTLGSTPDASVIGNTAERGHGMALYADRFNFVCGMEVVLPQGEVVNTGFASMTTSKLGPLAKWGLGPYLDGLFTQSNLGIITGLTLWLRPKSAFFQSFIFHINDENNLAKVIDQWRQMRLEGFNASLRIFNDVRMISFGERFPADEKSPLSDRQRSQIRSRLKIGKWIGLGGLYPVSQQHANADREFIKDRIGEAVDNITFYDQATVSQLYEQADAEGKRWLDFMFNKTLLRGYTSSAGVNMTYWRKPASVQVNDIHQDKCGVLWYCPAIPFTGKDVQKAISICARVSKKFRFELNIGFLFISERTLDITGAICYDREVKDEDRKALECHHALMDALSREGYSPYRLGIQSMELIKLKSKSSTQILRDIKRSLDPKSVLAPGHYI